MEGQTSIVLDGLVEESTQMNKTHHVDYNKLGSLCKRVPNEK